MTISLRRRCDHFLDQPSQAADIAGGIDGIAKPDDHQMLRRDDNGSLAEVAGCKKSVARYSEPDAPLGMFVLTAIGPEAGAIVGAERGGRRRIHPVFVQDMSAADHPVIQIE